jgi:hypothetical protein
VGETFNSKPPGPIIMIGQSERNMEQQLNHIYYTLLWQSVRLCYAFYQPQQTIQKCWAKTILLSQTSIF